MKNNDKYLRRVELRRKKKCTHTSWQNVGDFGCQHHRRLSASSSAGFRIGDRKDGKIEKDPITQLMMR
ncbi:hypothetical protein C0J52_27629 [Blattella germanica]|nr:hypothetical protein C0J52_27629 [Blattella germanica]